ncbi:MAG TPA: hypothetical protein PLA84_04640 [Petrotogaceae bacterium]|nr:hypothetical protein [Petrotogaceae bacterium]
MRKSLFFLATVLLTNLILFIFKQSIKDFIYINVLFFAGIYDYYKYIIPETAVITIIVLSIIDFKAENLLFSLVAFFSLLIFYRQRKIGFGDIQLISSIFFLNGYETLFILAIACVLMIILNFRKDTIRIPMGFYLMLGATVFFISDLLI